MGILADWQIKRDVKIEPRVEVQAEKGVISFGPDSYGYSARLGYTFKVFTPVHCGVVDPKGLDPRSFVDVDLTPETHNWSHLTDTGPPFRCVKCLKTCYYPEEFMNPCVEKSDHILIPPNSFALGETVETFTIPRDCLAICLNKSTYARLGIICNITPLEPEWHGKVTVEISNTTPLPAKVYPGEGLMQVIFLRTDGYTELALRDVANVAARTGHLLDKDTQDEAVRLSTCRVSYADKKGKYANQKGLTLPFVKE